VLDWDRMCNGLSRDEKGGLYLLLKNGEGELGRRMNVQDTDGQERTADGGTGLGI
jgi:hypothetical protein